MSCGLVSLLQDFVDPLRATQLTYSTYDDKDYFLFDQGQYLRTNLFEEGQNNACMDELKFIKLNLLMRCLLNDEKIVSWLQNSL